MTAIKIAETEFYIDWEEDTGQEVKRWREWKDLRTYQEGILQTIREARDYFQTAFNDWDTLTVAQKDNVMKQVTRAMLYICKHLLNDYSKI